MRPRRGRPRIWEPDAVRVDTKLPADVFRRLCETADAAGVSVQQVTRAIVEHQLEAELEVDATAGPDLSVRGGCDSRGHEVSADAEVPL